MNANPASSDSPAPEIERGYTRCRYGQLHYLEGRPVTALAPTLILLHQNPSSSLEYEPLLAEMARDRHVIAFDTCGYGMSDPPPRPLSMDGYAAAIADGILAMGLAAHAPLDLFGYHTGSLLAIELGLLLGESVGRLVLSGIPMREPAARAERLQAARATPAPTEDGAAILAMGAALWRYVVTERNTGVPLEHAAALFAEKFRTLHRGWWAYEGVWSYDYDRLAGLRQATLVLQPHEPLLEYSRAACALLPDGRFLELPELDRDIFEVGIDPLCRAMRAFLTPVPENRR